MTATNESRIEISEQTTDGVTVYHWTIYDHRGNEYSHSAYHLDRATCEAEANERRNQAIADGTL